MPGPTLPRVISACFLSLSVLLNVFFASSWIWASFTRNLSPALDQGDQAGALVMQHDQKLNIEPTRAAGWSRRASDEAEAAALFNCSGNGDLYVDTTPTSTMGHNIPVSSSRQSMSCECYECFTGPRCANLVENCSADVDSGDPLLFAPFWKQNAEESTVVIPGWYRMGYKVIESSGYLSLTPSLEEEIQTLHNLVGNAVVQDKYIVLGLGTSLLINAIVASLSSATTETPTNVVSAVPYYGLYRSQTELLETSHYTWDGDANIYAEQRGGTSNGTSIELVTSPNNPDGKIRNAVVNGSNALAIYDLVYYWPHFTAITAAMDHDVMLFTLSKVTGHAGSRIGWAIVRDHTLYEKLLRHILLNTLGITHESQLRATQLLRSINKAYSDQLRRLHDDATDQRVINPLSFPPAYYASKGMSFHYAYATLRYRWKKLSQTIETYASQRLGLQPLEPTYCNFFKEVTGPSPAYAWVHCKQESDEDCEALLKQAGIISRAGTTFGSSARYTRLSLLKRDSVFENLIDRLSILMAVSEEETILPQSNQIIS